MCISSVYTLIWLWYTYRLCYKLFIICTVYYATYNIHPMLKLANNMMCYTSYYTALYTLYYTIQATMCSCRPDRCWLGNRPRACSLCRSYYWHRLIIYYYHTCILLTYYYICIISAHSTFSLFTTAPNPTLTVQYQWCVHDIYMIYTCIYYMYTIWYVYMQHEGGDGTVAKLAVKDRISLG